MGIRTTTTTVACAAMGVLAMSSAHANLIVNGNFSASTDNIATPPGWTQLGPSDGVIADSNFGTPAYNGATAYYDFGGYGDSAGTQGDGISQMVATTVGQSYTMTFGLSGENGSGNTQLKVLAGPSPVFYPVSVNSSYLDFQKPWVTETISFTATSASTLIEFMESSPTADNGDNDPLVTGINLGPTAVPLPATLPLLGLGLAGLGFMRRRKAI